MTGPNTEKKYSDSCSQKGKMTGVKQQPRADRLKWGTEHEPKKKKGTGSRIILENGGPKTTMGESPTKLGGKTRGLLQSWEMGESNMGGAKNT